MSVTELVQIERLKVFLHASFVSYDCCQYRGLAMVGVEIPECQAVSLQHWWHLLLPREPAMAGWYLLTLGTRSGTRT